MQLAGCYQLWTSPKVKNGAEIVTEFHDGGKRLTGTYVYKNAAGGKFAVLPYDMEKSSIHSSAFTSYLVQPILFKAYEFLTDRQLPLRCGNEPYVYTILKENEKGYALGIWNFSDDSLRNYKVEVENGYVLDKVCSSKAEFKDDTVIIDFLAAKGFCAVTVKKKYNK